MRTKQTIADFKKKKMERKKIYSLVPRKMTPFLDGTGFYANLFCVLKGESKVRERE